MIFKAFQIKLYKERRTRILSAYITLDQKNGEHEYLVAQGFVKTEGFEKSVAFLMTLMQQIWEVSQKYKSFRMEMDYDAETLNTYYRFYVPDTISGSNCSVQEFSTD